MNAKELLAIAAALGPLSCLNQPAKTVQPTEVSAVVEDNGSWGNGSWGNGSWGNGSWGNGSWGNGTWGNGTWGNGTWGNGTWGNGTWGNGTWGNGTWGNGTWGNGTWGNGTWGNGTWGNGSWGNGSWGNGTWGNGMLFESLSVGSLNISNLVDTSLSSEACGPLGIDPEVAMTELMVFVATIQCALPSPCAAGDLTCLNQLDCATDPNCRVITDCDGNELYVGGQSGLGTNQSDPMVVANVDACIDATLAELNEEFRAYADNLNSYAVSCALPMSSGTDCANDPGCVEVTYQHYPSGTETKQYYGAIGLAPNWKTNPDFDLDLQGQRRVSACLASRTNPHRKKVQISIRGIDIPTTDTERNVYSHHEGAFWGNMFAENPVVHSCSVNGVGPSGRICTSGECDFVDEGHCDVACVDKDADGNYTNCGPEGSTDVINTFLPLRTVLSDGYEHRCVVRADGTTWCWGRGWSYQLGNGIAADSELPVEVSTLGTGVVEIALGDTHSCARKSDGSVWCWGFNLWGPVGNGTTETATAPIEITSLNSDVAQIATGKWHTCAVKTDGTLWCWGYNILGQLGVPSAGQYSTEPIQVGLDGVIRVYAGAMYSCALTTDRLVWCWGSNHSGALANGGYDDSPTPVLTALPAGTQDVSLGKFFGCALNENGTVWCWGDNYSGALGNNQVGNDPNGSIPTPTQVINLPHRAISIGAGDGHSCAILEDGSLWCWGANTAGQLGLGDTQNRLIPTHVSLPGAAAELIATASGTQVILEEGSVYTFGWNQYDQLGVVSSETCTANGVTAPCSTVPLRMSNFDNCGDDLCDFGESEGSCPADCAPLELFFDDFSDGLGKWTLSGGGDFRTEAILEPVTPPGGSGGDAAHANQCTSYCNITIDTAGLDLASYSEVTVSFLRFIDTTFDAQDFLKLRVHDGAQWTTVRKWQGGGQGDDGLWHEESFSLLPYLGGSDLKIRFGTKSSQANEQIQLDDVRIVVR